MLARKVWAGPSEASAIGNIAVQALALDLFWDVQEARHAIRRSFSQQTYEPEDAPAWDKAYKHFKAHILGALSGRTH